MPRQAEDWSDITKTKPKTTKKPTRRARKPSPQPRRRPSPTKKEPEVQLSVRCPGSYRKRLRLVAAKNDTTVAQLVIEGVEAVLKKYRG